ARSLAQRVLDRGRPAPDLRHARGHLRAGERRLCRGTLPRSAASAAHRRAGRRLGGRVMPGMRPDDDAAEVEEVNARFYRALEGRDLDEMDRLWAHGEGVRCIHPGWTLLSGWETVRQSWDAIFKDQREMRFTIGEVDVHVEADLAWVTCTESILSQAQGN